MLYCSFKRGRCAIKPSTLNRIFSVSIDLIMTARQNNKDSLAASTPQVRTLGLSYDPYRVLVYGLDAPGNTRESSKTR